MGHRAPPSRAGWFLEPTGFWSTRTLMQDLLCEVQDQAATAAVYQATHVLSF
jgi:hypothetical protein